MTESLPELLYVDGDRYFQDLIHAIEGAQVTLDFETYIFDDDELGRRVAVALKDAAARGVSVRLLVDGAGSVNFPFQKSLEQSGVHVRIYRPLGSVFLKWLFKRRRTSDWVRINRRNHRKVALIDGHTLWLGSMNVSAHHLPSVMTHRAWVDVGVRARVDGDLASVIQLAFQSAFNDGFEWQSRRQARRDLNLACLARPDLPYRTTATPTLRKRILRDWVQRIRRAQERVWFINAYFVPPPQLLRALLSAALKGTDVRLILPGRSDVWVVRMVSKLYYRILLSAGVRIWEYPTTVLHAKAFLIDQVYEVGSTNLNHRSWLHDLEANWVLTHPEAQKDLEDRFLELESHSVRVAQLPRGPLASMELLLGKMLSVFRRWL